MYLESELSIARRGKSTLSLKGFYAFIMIRIIHS